MHAGIRSWIGAMVAGLLAAACLVLVGELPARADGPSAEPILELDPGMHTAVLRGVSVDAAGRYLATASDDKTVRVWSLADGALLGVLRPPVGPGAEGKLYTLSLSPDGSTVACGGWTGYAWDSKHNIYLFERHTGRLAHRLGGMPNVIKHLAFSRDGSRLGVVLGGKNGLRVWDTRSWSLVGQDTDYGDQAYGLDFDPAGRLVTTCYDGYVRLYDQAVQLVTKVKATGGSRPKGVAFSPDGTRLALGYGDGIAVNVLSGRDLSLLYSPDTSGLGGGNLESVTWSRDGETLYAGGRYIQGARWSRAGRGTRSALHSGRFTDTVMSMHPLDRGELVVGAASPAWAVLRPSGESRLFQGAPIADFRDLEDAFRLSTDGTTVDFGFQQGGKDPAEFSLGNRSLRKGSGRGLAGPATTTAGLEAKNWKNSYSPTVNGHAMALEEYEMSRSVALFPDHDGLIVGADWNLYCFNTTGGQVWKISIPGAAWAVNVSRDGRVVAAALGDGTIRWYRPADGKEVLALYPHPDQQRWVAWTPEGYYDASPGAEDFIGWRVNNGLDQAADFFPAGQFRDRFYQPRVVAEVLNTRDTADALRLAQARPAAVPVTASLPPVVAILSPEEGTSYSGGEVDIRFSVRSADPVTEVKLLLDGRPVETRRGLTVQATGGGTTRSERLAMPGRDATVGVLAVNKHGASSPASVRLKWAGRAASQEFAIRPKLYVLAVGVSDYVDDHLDLKLAAKDARDFAAAAKAMGQGLYREVEVRTLTDKDATRTGVLKGLRWLSSSVTQHDVAMLFLAGHGVNDVDGTYYFLPRDADVELPSASGVIFAEIKRTVENLAGKRVVFVDTCHAGNVMGRRGGTDINAVVSELASASSGAVVFSSSTGNQYSLEKSEWGNGAFTKALVEGLSGKADMQGSGRITVNMLDLYISERVKSLTHGEQTPVTTKPPNTPDFPVAVRR